ncbi:hypothetical protein GCM10010234_12090 [Streptomyces hawaiiensis]|uniref:hypothetical protein n=1 Tax=Streptomyces hawaiiensis TaxID=67305 RepID=UPI0031DBF80D
MLPLAERDLLRVTATPVPCHDGLGQVVLPLLHGLARQMEHLESRGTPRLADNVIDLTGTLLAEHADGDRRAGEAAARTCSLSASSATWSSGSRPPG